MTSAMNPSTRRRARVATALEMGAGGAVRAAALALALLGCTSAGDARAEHTTGSSGPSSATVCAPSPLYFGTSATEGEIAASGERDCWRFDGGASDRVRVRVVATSGTVDPVASVSRPAGTRLCGPTATETFTCTLDATGTHRIAIADSNGTRTGRYRISVQRLNNPVGCTPLSFATSTRQATILERGETDCWRFDGAAGDRVRLRQLWTWGALSTRAEFVRADGTTQCPARALEFTCALDSGGTQTILVLDPSHNSGGGYALGIQRLNDPVGCSGLAFATTPAPGRIAGIGETDCWRVDGATGDLVSAWTLNTAGALSGRVELVRPNGTTRCGPTRLDLYCAIDASGLHTILVQDDDTDTGDYLIGLQRLNNPVGCGAVLLVGAAPRLEGSTSVPGERDCWRFDGVAGDEFRLHASAPSGSAEPFAEILRPDGQRLCDSISTAACSFNTTATYTLTVSNPGAATGDYTVWIDR